MSTSTGFPNNIVDSFGREITYLRLSVTDRCDFRCRYCMAENMVFVPRSQVLSLEECALVAQAFVELGVRKIRLTGGEPLVRENVVSLARDISHLDGLDELVMTTNGSQLQRHAHGLAEAGVRRLNISLDSLDAESFHTLTRTGNLNRVLAGIQAARDAGFERIKINAVILKGFNEDQVMPLLHFCLERGLDISFIEEMPLGDIGIDHSRSLSFMPSAEIRRRISEHYSLIPSTLNTGGPSRYWKIEGYESRVGCISPHSENFCGSCNRLRIMATGQLIPCLGHENAVDLLGLTRDHPGEVEPLKEAILNAVVHKPERHEFHHDSNTQVVRFMNMTGG